MKEKIQGIIICLVVFLCAFGFIWIKIQAYNGDPDCLFIKCVKVIPK
jgi:hypothetical protein